MHSLQTQVFRTASLGIWSSSSLGMVNESHQHSVAVGSAARAHWLGPPQSGHLAVSKEGLFAWFADEDMRDYPSFFHIHLTALPNVPRRLRGPA